jgi:hypothetical protein
MGLSEYRYKVTYSRNGEVIDTMRVWADTEAVAISHAKQAWAAAKGFSHFPYTYEVQAVRVPGFRH